MTQDIAEAQALNSSVLLAGDLNAHTGIMLDFVPRGEHADIPNDILPNNEHLLAAAPARALHDRDAPNAFGKQLIAVCQDASLLILNGRVDGDASGQLTCHTHNGSSLVDYIINISHCKSLHLCFATLPSC